LRWHALIWWRNERGKRRHPAGAGVD